MKAQRRKPRKINANLSHNGTFGEEQTSNAGCVTGFEECV